jgi:hypothetical protein
MESAETFSELENDLEYSEMKKKEEQAQQQQFQAQMQQQQIEANNQAQLQRTQMEQAGANERTKSQNIAKIAAADIKREEVHPRDTQPIQQ